MANQGVTEAEIIQNRFTAYLITAIQKRKGEYLKAKAKYKRGVVDFESDNIQMLASMDEPFSYLSVLEQLDNPALINALKAIPKKSREILFMHIVDGLTFPQIAKQMGIKEKNAALICRRLIKKMKKSIGGKTDEF